MTLHIETLAMAAFTVAFALTISLTAMGVFLKDQPGLWRWVQSLWLAMFGAIFLGMRGNVPDFVPVVMGHLMLVLSAALTWVGMREFCGRSVDYKLVLTFVAVFLGIHVVFFVWWPSRLIRGLNFHVMTAVCDSAIAWTLYRNGPKDLSKSVRLISLLFVVEALYSIVILVYRVFDPNLQDPSRNYRIEVVNYIEGIIVGTCKVVGFVIMLSHKLMAELHRVARSDGLTGILNRRALDIEADKVLELCRRLELPCTLVMADLDRFKFLNDNHGHAVGDEALRHFAGLTNGELRKTDIFGRYGGEEFCILMPGTNSDHALSVVTRVKDLVERSPVIWEGKTIPLTVSMGVASCAKEDFKDYGAMVQLADRCLYRAKTLGRNRIEFGCSTKFPT
jgi:diguanylate cyclase (GGDEF)-like protein